MEQLNIVPSGALESSCVVCEGVCKYSCFLQLTFVKAVGVWARYTAPWLGSTGVARHLGLPCLAQQLYTLLGDHISGFGKIKLTYCSVKSLRKMMFIAIIETLT